MEALQILKYLFKQKHMDFTAEWMTTEAQMSGDVNEVVIRGILARDIIRLENLFDGYDEAAEDYT
jgi:hypothetical protein